MFFLKNCLITGEEYTKEFLTFIRDAKRANNLVTSARIQSICKKHNTSVGCFDGSTVNTRNNKEKDSIIYTPISFLFNLEVAKR